MRYKIHEAAKMLGISPQTLRFYEQYGILTHERAGEGGYRQYTDVSMDLLMSLRKCRNCGFTVAQTAQILREADGGRIGEALEERAETLERQAEMQLRIAGSLRATAALTRRVEAGAGRFEERERPEGVARVVKRAGAQRPEPSAMEQVGIWAEWLPLVRWMIRYRPDDLEKGERPDYGFIVDAKNAAFLGVEELAGIEHIPPCACLYTLMRWRTGTGEVLDCVRRGAEEADRRGLRLCGAPIVSTLWNAGATQEPVSCGEFWFPIEK